MSTSTAPAIELVGVHKSFRPIGKPPTEAVRGIDLTVGRGEIVA